jgi:hypothetical protein
MRSVFCNSIGSQGVFNSCLLLLEQNFVNILGQSINSWFKDV